MWMRYWNVEQYQGSEVYIEIADLRSDAPLGYIAVDDIREQLGTVAVEGEMVGAAPPMLRLGMPFPNPAPRGATVPLVMERAGRVRVAVYDVQGRLRQLLHDGPLTAGSHQLAWNGRDAGGRRLAAGTYFLRLDGAAASSQRKIIVAP
jgi:hypothetical protein